MYAQAFELISADARKDSRPRQFQIPAIVSLIECAHLKIRMVGVDDEGLPGPGDEKAEVSRCLRPASAANDCAASSRSLGLCRSPPPRVRV